MNTKQLTIICIIGVLCVGAGAYMMFFSTPEYMNITMNGVTFEVPKSNATVTNQSEHMSLYNDSQSNIAITVFDSEGMGLDDFGEATAFAAVRDTFQTGAQLQENSNLQYNHSDTLNVYTYLTNYGHKNVFIVTKNKEDMEHILLKLSSNPITISLNDTDNATNNTTAAATKSSTNSKKSSESEKSEYGDYIDDEYVSMSEEEYAERYPALYHEQSLSEGKYDKYHPEMYDVDRENGYI